MDIITGTLPKKSVFWGCALPYSRRTFQKCWNEESDFIESLKCQFKTSDFELLWLYYEPIASEISTTIKFLRKKGVTVVELLSLDQLEGAFSYKTILITVHRHRKLDVLDFMGNDIPIDEFIQTIPENFEGWVDISSCYSSTFQMKCKKRAIHANFIAAETESSVRLRMFIYQETIRYLVSHKKSRYLDSLRIIIARIIKQNRQSGSIHDVFLGGDQYLDLLEKDKISDKSITVDNKVKSFFPKIEKNKRTFRDILFRNKYKDVYSSIFALAEVKRKSHMLVQVYLHLYEESEKVKLLAQESDKNAERRDYIPLSLKLKKGDKVDVEFNVYGETRLMSERKLIEWRGSFVKSSFDYFVPKDIDVEELSCVVLLSVNGVPLGEMRFITQIVDVPRRLNPEIVVNKYKKVFISYSHQDESKVKFLHEGLELGSVPHFFDRAYLKTGDVFPQKIQDYIESADLFILCWSQNASESHYVQKERMLAIERAFPKVQPESRAKLRIYPLSIEPRADLPSDMKGIYNFGEI